MQENLGIKITASSAAGSVISRINSQVEVLSKTSKEVKANFKSTLKYMKLAAGSALFTKKVADGFGAGVSSAADLEQAVLSLKKELLSPEKSLKNINDELKAVEDTAFKVQAITPFKQMDVIGQAETLKKANVSIEDITSGALEMTAALAAVEELDPKLTASIVATSNSLFKVNEQKEGFKKLGDIISGATSLANFGVADFGETLKESGAAFSALGAGIEEVAISTAAVGNVMKGGRAGTGLQAFIRSLSKKRKDLIFDDTEKPRKFADTIKLLNEELSGLTAKQKDIAKRKIFDETALPIVDALLNNYGKVEKSIGNQASLTEKLDVILSGLNKKTEALAGTSSSIISKLFTPALDPAKKLVDYATEFVNKIGEATSGENNLGKVVSGASAGALAVGGTATAAFGLMTLLKGKKLLKSGGGLGGLLGGVGGTAAGMAKGSLISKISGGAIQEVYVVNADEIAGGASSVLPTPGSPASSSKGGIFGAITGFLSTKLKSAGGLALRFGTFVRGLIVTAGGSIATFSTSTLLPALQTAFVSVGSALAGSALAVGSAIGLTLGGAIGYFFEDEINTFLENYAPSFNKFLEDLLPKFGEAGELEEKNKIASDLAETKRAENKKKIYSKILELKKAGEEEKASKMMETFKNSSVFNPKIYNEINMNIDKDKQIVSSSSGKAETKLKANFKPATD